MRQVAHKNVCRMYDVGEVDGLPFLTMEYVDGEDLSSLLRRIGRLPEDKALDLGRQLCAGLAAAHERGILHRDLKPANVMIDGEGARPHHRLRTGRGSPAAGQSRASTPAYMAPELLAGGEASVHSDIYALGLVLYELFTGRRAFVAQNIAELVVFAFLAGRDVFVGAPAATWINVSIAVLVVGVLTIVATRVGLLGTVAAFLASFVLSATPWTFDPGAWYFPPSATALAFLCGLALFCGYAARTAAPGDVGLARVT